MTGHRDIKRVARQRLHSQMAVPAYYIVAGAAPAPVDVRVHTKFGTAGRLNNDPQWAERADEQPALIFNASQLSPAIPLRRGSVVSVEAGEAYRIDNSDPVDDAGFIRARVTKMSLAETAGLPVRA